MGSSFVVFRSHEEKLRSRGTEVPRRVQESSKGVQGIGPPAAMGGRVNGITSAAVGAAEDGRRDADLEPRPSRGVSGRAPFAPPARGPPRAASSRVHPPESPARPDPRGRCRQRRAWRRRGLGPAGDRLAGRRRSWSVSVVQLAGKWSVTLDGGGPERFRRCGPIAGRSPRRSARSSRRDGPPRPRTRLPRCPPRPARRPAFPRPPRRPASRAPPPRPEWRASCGTATTCERCGRGLIVVYESGPDEPRELAPVACPHCWAIGHVEVGAWAAAGPGLPVREGLRARPAAHRSR